MCSCCLPSVGEDIKLCAKFLVLRDSSGAETGGDVDFTEVPGDGQDAIFFDKFSGHPRDGGGTGNVVYGNEKVRLSGAEHGHSGLVHFDLCSAAIPHMVGRNSLEKFLAEYGRNVHAFGCAHGLLSQQSFWHVSWYRDVLLPFRAVPETGDNTDDDPCNEDCAQRYGECCLVQVWGSFLIGCVEMVWSRVHQLRPDVHDRTRR